MKILSCNVDGLQARLGAVTRLAEELQPDIMCFQKVRIKGNSNLQIPGYMGMMGSMKQELFGCVRTYIRQGLPFDMNARQCDIPQWLRQTGCLNVIRFNAFALVNAYVPYTNLKNEQFVKNRRRWDYEFLEYMVRLTGQLPVVLCGDLNIVAQDIDAWDGVSVRKLGCFTEQEHRNFDSLAKQTGLVDTYRYLHPDGREFSYFFQNRAEYRRANQGFRIDYCLVSKELLQHVKRSEILTDVTVTSNSPLLIDLDVL